MHLTPSLAYKKHTYVVADAVIACQYADFFRIADRRGRREYGEAL